MVEFRIRIRLFKIFKVRQVRPTEPVDSLVIIPDHEHILSTDKADQFKLGKIRILEFINQDIWELTFIPSGNDRFLLQGFHRQVDHIVKIDEPVVKLILLIGSIHRMKIPKFS